MPIYCDESGGVGAGVMTFAGVSLPDGAADGILSHYRAVTGLRGELKGSRTDLAERAFLLEMLFARGGRAVVAGAFTHRLIGPEPGARPPQDIRLYARLLETVVDAWLPQTGGCADLVIDDGRYDAGLNGLLRDDVQAALGQWGKAQLVDSHRCAGIQIADVLANSFYQIGIDNNRSSRIEALVQPFRDDGRLRFIEVTSIG